MGKLFTRTLNNRLQSWSDRYGIITEAQAGFRKKYSTVDQIFVLHSLISHVLHNKQKLYCAFIDFRRAFDSINHKCLWYKLIKCGIRGSILNVIRSMYRCVKSRVIGFDGGISETMQCLVGVRQGECLSPFLFALSINDMEHEIGQGGTGGVSLGNLKLFLLLYAHDSVIFSETPGGLQVALDTMLAYCQRWTIKLNTSKTKIMIFRKGGRLPQDLSFTYDNHPLEIVSNFIYLGINFSTTGSFICTQKTLAGQAKKAMFSLNQYRSSFVEMNPHVSMELFDKLIVPILLYGSELWGFNEGRCVELVHIGYCKSILGVKRSTPNDMVRSELGRTDLRCRRLYNIVKFWLKII